MKLKPVDKAISVLDFFSIEGQMLGVGDISAITGYPKSTVIQTNASACVWKPSLRGGIK